MDRAVVVTGASTGIGRAVVAKAIAEGAHAFAGVRKPADADGLTAEFGDRVTPLVFDVTDGTAVRVAAAQAGTMLGKRRLFGLVNNAGVAVAGPLLHLDVDDLRRQMEINLIGVHQVTQAFAPLLGADPDREGPPGRIVMISSVAGKRAMPFLGPYAASKHALEGYSEALRRELIPFGVDVLVIAPGAVATPIWDKAEDARMVERFGNTRYGDTIKRLQSLMLDQGRDGLPPTAIADLVWRRLTGDKPSVRTTILRGRFLNHTLPSMLSARTVDRLIARRLGLTPPP
jgi:hypothetical protein